jgi:putative zinc finger protein
MTAHPTPEQLAEHAEGVLGAADAAALDAHLAGCAACQAVQEDLRGLRAVLASDRPGPMPADVAARIDAALAGLSAARAGQPEAAGAPDGPRPVDLLRRRERYRRYTRLATVAAGLVLVVGGSVLGVQLARDPGPTPTSVGQGGGEPVGGLAEDSGPGSGSAPAAPEAGRVLASPSGRNYDRAGFAGQVSALLRSDRVRGADEGAEKGAGRELPGAAAGDRLVEVSGCAARLAKQTGQPGMAPLAADVATWEGRPALIIVLPVPGAPASVHAYVVPRDCAAPAAAGVPVLHDAVLPSPTPG